jgi:hypothetical protein
LAPIGGGNLRRLLGKNSLVNIALSGLHSLKVKAELMVRSQKSSCLYSLYSMVFLPRSLFQGLYFKAFISRRLYQSLYFKAFIPKPVFQGCIPRLYSKAVFQSLSFKASTSYKL